MFFVSTILISNDAMWTITKFFEGYFILGRSYPGIVSCVVAGVIALIVLHAMLAVRKFPINWRQYRLFRGHMKMMRHEDTTLWFWQVFTGFALFFLATVAPVRDADAAAPHRTVRVGRPRVDRPLLAALHPAAARRRIPRRHRALSAAPSSGSGSPAPTPNATRKRLKTLKWALTVFFLVLGLRDARRVHQDRHRARAETTASPTFPPRWRRTGGRK